MSETITVEEFEAHRPLLFSLAYRMLGTVTGAEDVLQDAYLRIHGRAADHIEKPQSYLTTTVTRLCLNRLSAARAQREQYVGPWLPEPVATEQNPQLVNPLERVMLHDSISVAFLVVLESLSPAERAVFLLHEVFDYKFREIGEILDKSDAACRQLFRRARQHIAENRPRFDATPQQVESILTGFVQAAEMGEFDAFLHLLAEDVALVPDGGGQRGAATRVLRGRSVVQAFIQGVQRIAPDNLRYELVTLNGERALLARTADGRPFFALFVGVRHHAVHYIYSIAGRKLRGLA